MTETLTIVIEGQDRASGVFGDVSKALSGVRSNASAAGKSATGFGNILGNITQTAMGMAAGLGIFSAIQGAVQGIGSAAIGTNANLEQMTISLESIMTRELKRGEAVTSTSRVAIAQSGAEAGAVKAKQLAYETMGFKVKEAYQKIWEMENRWKSADTMAVGKAKAEYAELQAKYQSMGDEISVLTGKTVEYGTVTTTTFVGAMNATDAAAASIVKTKTFFAELVNFANHTPFELEGLVKATTQLMNAGFTSKTILPMMTAVGDAIAGIGGGNFEMDRVVYALSQMQSATKVTAQDMRQLTEARIPAWQWLANVLKTDVAGAMKQVEARTVDAKVMMDAFSKGSAADFGGMMAKQMKTFSGALTTVKDSLKLAIASAFKPFFSLLSKGMVGLADFLTGDTFNNFATSLNNLATGAIANLSKALPYVQVFFQALSQGNIAGALRIAQLAIEAFTTVVKAKALEWSIAVVSWASDWWTYLKPELAKIIPALWGWLGEQVPKIEDQMSKWKDAFSKWAGDWWAYLQPKLAAIPGDIAKWVGEQKLADKFESWKQGVIQWATDWWNYLLPEMQKLPGKLQTWIDEQRIGEKFESWRTGALQWVTDWWAGLGPMLTTVQAAISTWISEQTPKFEAQLRSWVRVFIDWTVDVKPGVIKGLEDTSTTVIGWIGRQGPKFAESIKSWPAAIGSWLPQAGTDLGRGLAGLDMIVLTWITNSEQSISSGIEGMSTKIHEALSGLFKRGKGGSLFGQEDFTDDPVIQGLYTALFNFTKNIVGWFATTAVPMLAQIGGWVVGTIVNSIVMAFGGQKIDWTVFWENVRLTFITGWATILLTLQSFGPGFVGAGAGIMALFKVQWDADWLSVTTGLDATWATILANVDAAWKQIVETIRGGVNQAIGFINTLLAAWNAIKIEIPAFSVDVPIIGRQSFAGWKLEMPQVPMVPLIPAPGMANGGMVTRGGGVIVGERGPEYLNLPRGASVTPNGGGIDYDRLAAVIISALAGQQIVLQVDGQRIAAVARTNLQARGAGGLGY